MIEITERGVELPVDGRFTSDGHVQLLGNARRRADGKWESLAIVGSNLCIVEVTVTFGDQGR